MKCCFNNWNWYWSISKHDVSIPNKIWRDKISHFLATNQFNIWFATLLPDYKLRSLPTMESVILLTRGFSERALSPKSTSCRREFLVFTNLSTRNDAKRVSFWRQQTANFPFAAFNPSSGGFETNQVFWKFILFIF